MTNEEKQSIILAYEEKTARYIASELVQKPKPSVWMILVPLIFLPFMQKTQEYKAKHKAFLEGYLYTKKIALDKAYQIYQKELSIDRTREAIIQDIHKNPNADPRVLNIYEKQVQEVQLLCDHYLALLSTNGTNYQELVRSYYKTYDNYMDFINKLLLAENEVVNAASTTFKNDRDTVEVPEIMERMKMYLAEFRHEEATKLFPN